jgi:hypothetical protein
MVWVMSLDMDNVEAVNQLINKMKDSEDSFAPFSSLLVLNQPAHFLPLPCVSTLP